MGALHGGSCVACVLTVAVVGVKLMQLQHTRSVRAIELNAFELGRDYERLLVMNPKTGDDK